MNYLLAIETSGKAGSVAIVDRRKSEDSVRSMQLPADQGSAQSLTACIQQLMRDAGLISADLGCIALLSGPGSFTGLRVGVATAKTLAYALKIPVVELDTLRVIYEQFLTKQLSQMGTKPQISIAHCMLDAYRGQLFVCRFPADAADADQGTGQPTANSCLTQVQDIDQFLTQAMDSGLDAQVQAFVGPGCDRLQRYIAKEAKDTPAANWSQRVLWEAGDDMFPQAETVAKLGLDSWTRGSFVDPFQLAPHYYRASAAEEKAKAQS